jgi:general secretion pathway protein D
MCSYTVNEKTGKEMVQDTGSGETVLDVRSFFMGIEFPKGTSAYYRPDFKRLVVHQTPANLLAIDQMMSRFNKDPDYRQVEIETKFIEVEQKTLNELGFNWTFDTPGQLKMGDNWTADLAGQTLNSTLRSTASAFPGAASAGTMTLTKGGWMPLSLAIRALEQSSGADVLSSPSLTTQDGTPAEIWVGDREMMPTQVAPGSKGTSIFADYSGWAQKNIGVHLKVTPSVVKDDKKMINLDLKPEVIDLVGYDTYDITPDNATMMIYAGYPATYVAQSGRYPIPHIKDGVKTIIGTGWDTIQETLYNTPGAYSDDPNAASYASATPTAYGYFDTKRMASYDEYGVKIPQVSGSLPIFRLRKIETNMTVADGSTVGMGGLIYDKLETYKDKVPVLGSIPLIGRLFRSEGERSVKRNLMIFVTATQVDVNGLRSSDLATR